MTATVIERGQWRVSYANRMEYLSLGEGPRSLLFIPGGPGSPLPSDWIMRRRFTPYVAAGYRVSIVTRRRHMPTGSTVADMAQDYADVIRDDLGGRVDVVLGESFGGMIAQELAGRHPGLAGRVVLLASGCTVSEWGRDVDARLVAALERGDRRGAGEAFAEYLLPGPRLAWVRRLFGGPVVRRFVFGGVPLQDLIAESKAEAASDSRPVLPRIDVPVLIVAGDEDRFFPAAVVKETAALIGEHTVVWYRGKGHVGVVTSREVADDVLRFLS